MKLIKLDAIDSTNEFLKGLSSSEDLDNFTVVTAENQTKGKGQMGAVWTSELGKNLIMSVFVKDCLSGINKIYELNIAVAISVVQALEIFDIPTLSIKWPNDIMSYNCKIGGILIENNFKSSGELHSIIGIGLNVNQLNFELLPKASSLAVLTKKIFDKEVILFEIVKKIKENCGLIQANPNVLWDKYKQILFKIDVPMPFKDSNNKIFMGMIRDVSPFGKLQLQLEDESIAEYEIKQIQMLY